ncbi:hypothetical protein DIPPA_10812 [Diplonema papillatum]|nr:hypothetical protein DIPPA_10812 [Diplonema papillatum]
MASRLSTRPSNVVTRPYDLDLRLARWPPPRQLTTRNSSISERENEPRRAAAAPLCECGCRDVKKPAALRETEPNAAKAKVKKKSRLQNGIGKKMVATEFSFFFVVGASLVPKLSSCGGV